MSALDIAEPAVLGQLLPLILKSTVPPQCSLRLFLKKLINTVEYLSRRLDQIEDLKTRYTC
jgi:hypothetical protein